MNQKIYKLTEFPQLCKYGIKCTNIHCNYEHIFHKINEKSAPCNYGKNCNNKNCTFFHVKSEYEINYEQGKFNMIYNTVSHMKNFYNTDTDTDTNTDTNTDIDKGLKELFDLTHFSVNFDSDINLWNKVKRLNYCGLNHSVIPDAFDIRKNNLVLNFGNRRLGGGTLYHGNVQEEQITMWSSLLPFLINSNGWGGLPGPLKKSLADNPYVIRMNKFGNWSREIYGGNGVLNANLSDFIAENMIKFDEPVEFDWLCAAWPRLSNSDGRDYKTINMLIKMFITTYKVFVTGLKFANLDENGNIRILIGSMGCGAFNHCVHIAYSILILSLYCAVVNSSLSNLEVVYYTYDKNMFDVLNGTDGAVGVLDKLRGQSVEDCVRYIWELCQRKDTDKWRKKITVDTKV